MAHKLLIADDSVTIQRVIELTFADEDIEVTAVGDGRQAIDLISSDPPDIVLADVDMPERNGFEVASFIKENPQLSGIPVLLLTGAFAPVDEEQVRRAGCDGVLAKPFEPQMLIARVKDLLAGREPSSMPDTPPQSDERPAPSEPEPPVAAAAASAPAAAAEPLPEETSALSATGQTTPSRAPLDEYFDQLDAAFSNLASRGPAPSKAGEDGEPTLARTFSALLDVEQGDGTGAAVPTLERRPPVSIDDIADEVTRRVVAALADRAIREQVAEIVAVVAEKLVREEIERLKAGIKP